MIVGDVSTGTRPSLNKPLLLKSAQGLADGRARDAKALHQLYLAGQTPCWAVFPCQDFGGEFAGDGVVF